MLPRRGGKQAIKLQPEPGDPAGDSGLIKVQQATGSGSRCGKEELIKTGAAGKGRRL